MWMDSYVQDTLIRDQIAEAQRHAARRHLLRFVKPSGTPTRFSSVIRRLAGSLSLHRLKHVMERMASS